MKIDPTRLDGVVIVEPRVFTDPRGFFFETYQQKRYRENGISCKFVQDNLSYSTKNTLRGLHYQNPNGQAKLVSVIKGEVFDVAVDIRKGSPNFGKWVGVVLSAENHRQLFIPQGFAHGFCVLSDDAVFSYKCSDFYTPDAEHGLIWDDPQIGIEWPVKAPLLSEKDEKYPCLQDVSDADLPVFEGLMENQKQQDLNR
jgi:dTDP-4-dehydrorhamnose 3,5-epimerase